MYKTAQTRPTAEGQAQTAPSRYVVGCDLGTTNSAVCFVDTAEQPWQVRTFLVPQVVAPGQVESLETLPSFLYQPAEGETARGALQCPWQAEDPEYVVGTFARDHGSLVPGRMISSAKSWLCHSGVDRLAPILPWHGATDLKRLSPVEASACVLAHIRQAWNARFPQYPLEQQDFVLTLPASFDEVARELTVKAAALAGLPRVFLIEEPQAAFYAWIYAHRHDWQQLVSPGQKILVIDIGGGTSDFTLIRVRAGQGGKIQFHRVAVGEHLILGGDNFDLALAQYLEQKLAQQQAHQQQRQPNELSTSNGLSTGASEEHATDGAGLSAAPGQAQQPETIGEQHHCGPDGYRLDARQWAILVNRCRQLKEVLLGENPPDRLTVNLPAAGRRLIGGGVQIEVTRQEAAEVILDGFFPYVRLDERPARRRSGFQEFGLPYAADAAITRYLAAFLTAHRFAGEEAVSAGPGGQWSGGADDPAKPDVVLFNGGVFNAPAIRRRVLDVLCHWFGTSSSQGDAPTAAKAAGHSQPEQTTTDGARSGQFVESGPKPRCTGENRQWQPIVLDNDRLDLAVARGAAYYGMVRRGEGVRIAAGLARTYYIGVEGQLDRGPKTPLSPQPDPQLAQQVDNPLARLSDTQVTEQPQTPLAQHPETQFARQQEIATSLQSESEAAFAASQAPLEQSSPAIAVCLVPAGVEPGQTIELSQRRFSLRVSEPVEFPLYVSSTRLTDKPGELVVVDREQMTPLPPIRTVLQTRKRSSAETVDVHLHARLTEIGTLELWCSQLEGKQSWRLQFDVRCATQTDVAPHQSAAEAEGFIDEQTWQQCHAVIAATFGPEATEKPEAVVKQLAAAAGMHRNAWPTSFCRRIWEALMDFQEGRRRSPMHEARWLNLVGFALRPGYGLAVDDWRVAETWRVVQGKLIHPTAMCRQEGWILWRRIAGGLLAGQQQAVAEPLLGPVRNLHRQLIGGKGRGEFGFKVAETAEIWRLLGSLELLPMVLKIELGNIMLDLLAKPRMAPVRAAMVWAIGRLGARVPLYGPLNTVLPAEEAAQWCKRLMDMAHGEPVEWLAVMQLARRTDDRYRDLPEKTRQAAVAWLQRQQAPEHFVTLVREGGRLDQQEQGLVFGESLPKGLSIG